MRLLFVLFKLPFWLYFLVAGGLYYLGELSNRDTQAQNQEMQRALAGQPPETVSLAEFSHDGNIGLADEVSVQGVINPDYNYELTKKRKGIDTTRFMYVLFDATDPEGSKVARGALVLSKPAKEKFVEEYYPENLGAVIDEAGLSYVVTLNGQAANSSDLSSLVYDAFEEQNLTKSDEFIYIEPFLEGRTVGLTPTMSADQMRNIIRGIGLFVAMIGLIKFAFRRKTRTVFSQNAPNVATKTASDLAMQAVSLPASGQPDAPQAAKDTPRRKADLIKVLAIAGLIGGLIYTSNFTYVAVFSFIAIPRSPQNPKLFVCYDPEVV